MCRRYREGGKNTHIQLIYRAYSLWKCYCYYIYIHIYKYICTLHIYVCINIHTLHIYIYSRAHCCEGSSAESHVYIYKESELFFRVRGGQRNPLLRVSSRILLSCRIQRRKEAKYVRLFPTSQEMIYLHAATTVSLYY